MGRLDPAVDKPTNRKGLISPEGGNGGRKTHQFTPGRGFEHEWNTKKERDCTDERLWFEKSHVLEKERFHPLLYPFNGMLGGGKG